MPNSNDMTMVTCARDGQVMPLPLAGSNVNYIKAVIFNVCKNLPKCES